MNIKGCVAMVLAGGRGERLGALTHYCPKPAIHFGDKYRIIDFTLGNCKNSGIHTIGVLSQYYSSDLHSYIHTAYECKSEHGGIYMLPSQSNENCYRGTADAVYKNIDFIEQFQPECVLVLAGDHIYQMDYGKMIAFHRETGADVTVASTPVPIKEASRFGILNADKTGCVSLFEEKPLYPKSNLASMGIYVFKWDALKRYLLADNASEQTRHDFGGDILPRMLREGESMYTYKFNGYWRDVGTVDSLWEANMDHIRHASALQLQNNTEETPGLQTSYRLYNVARGAALRQSVVSEGCLIFGKVEHSVLGPQVTVGQGAEIIDSVVMPGVYIGNNAKIYKTVVGPKAVIMDNTVIGAENGPDFFIDSKVCARGVSLVAPRLYIGKSLKFQSGSHIYEELLQKLTDCTNRAAKPYYDQISDYLRPQILSVYR